MLESYNLRIKIPPVQDNTAWAFCCSGNICDINKEIIKKKKTEISNRPFLFLSFVYVIAMESDLLTISTSSEIKKNKSRWQTWQKAYMVPYNKIASCLWDS